MADFIAGYAGGRYVAPPPRPSVPPKPVYDPRWTVPPLLTVEQLDVLWPLLFPLILADRQGGWTKVTSGSVDALIERLKGDRGLYLSYEQEVLDEQWRNSDRVQQAAYFEGLADQERREEVQRERERAAAREARADERRRMYVSEGLSPFDAEKLVREQERRATNENKH